MRARQTKCHRHQPQATPPRIGKLSLYIKHLHGPSRSFSRIINYPLYVRLMKIISSLLNHLSTLSLIHNHRVLTMMYYRGLLLYSAYMHWHPHVCICNEKTKQFFLFIFSSLTIITHMVTWHNNYSFCFYRQGVGCFYIRLLFYFIPFDDE